MTTHTLTFVSFLILHIKHNMEHLKYFELIMYLQKCEIRCPTVYSYLFILPLFCIRQPLWSSGLGLVCQTRRQLGPRVQFST